MRDDWYELNEIQQAAIECGTTDPETLRLHLEGLGVDVEAMDVDDAAIEYEAREVI